MPPKIDIVYDVDVVPLQVDGDALSISLTAQLKMVYHQRTSVVDELFASSTPLGHFLTILRSLDWVGYHSIIGANLRTPNPADGEYLSEGVSDETTDHKRRGSIVA